jgi:hypothetical protein
LFYDILNLKDGEEYIFCNRNYGVNQTMNKVFENIEERNKRTIELSYVPGYTLFDWCKVIENASEIHTVDTSINYVIEKLTLKSQVINLYPRHPEHTFKCLNKLFKTKWNWKND